MTDSSTQRMSLSPQRSADQTDEDPKSRLAAKMEKVTAAGSDDKKSRGLTQAIPAPPKPSRKARLRVLQVDAWSVMKTSFLLSIAMGIVTVVAVLVIWSVLGAAGVWDSINSMVQQAVGDQNGTPFDISDYLSTSRVMGFTLLVAVLDVVLITAIATLGAFLYNLAATLLGGVEVTLGEDD